MKNIAWSWRNAAFGAVISSVAAIFIAFGHVETGLALLIGAIPAAILGLPPRRKDRRQVLIVGILFGVSQLLGSILAQWTVVAVVGMFLLGLGAALLTTRNPIGFVVLTLCLPLAGVGLTYTGVEESIGVSSLFVLGSAIAFVGALCFPEYEGPPPPNPPLLSMAVARDYGVRLGLAAAVGTAIGLHYGADHTGWIVGSTLLVMRPSEEMSHLRGVGRAASVFAGGVIAAWLLTLDLRPVAIAIVAVAVIVAMTATNKSRWYVTPAFTTFVILWSLLYGQATTENIKFRFSERVLETLLGVGIAFFFGLLIPKLMRRRDTRSHVPQT
jgi:uncharacterized membrane protein YccC